MSCHIEIKITYNFIKKIEYNFQEDEYEAKICSIVFITSYEYEHFLSYITYYYYHYAANN